LQRIKELNENPPSPRVTLDDHRGNSTQFHIDVALNNYNNYLRHTIYKAVRLAMVEEVERGPAEESIKQ